MLPMLRRARLLRRKIALQQSRLAILKANASTAEVNPTTKASDATASTNNDRPTQQGLFGNFLLNHAGGFHLLSQAVGVRSGQLVTEIVSNAEARATDPSQPTTVELVDDLSNEICCAADLTDCVRCVHTDADYREAADESMRFYSSLVETLNTTPELYGALKRSLETEKGRLDPIGERTAQLLLDDFEQSGVLLQPEERQRFVHLSEEVFDAGTHFGLGCDRPVGQLNGPWSGNRDYRIRRATHSTYYQHNPEQESHLKRLITARHQIAQLIDHSSTFAHRAQRHSVLGTYENVHNFLQGTIKELSSKIDVQLEQIQRIVRDHSTNFDSAVDRLGLVDIQFATMISRRQLFEQIGPPLISSHFHLRTILEDFQLLVRELYGIRFRLLLPEPGECWSGNVFKLDVYRMADDSFLGTIFLDLDNRPTKLQGDCHFTVRCSKQLANGDFQTPIVVISLYLIPSKEQQKGNLGDKWHILDEATMLPQQADNFFHEMGHAMHSILGRTRFQHVAGTRCPTDFAEVPSHLMECFLSDTRILQKLFCDQSGRSLSQEQAEAIVQSRHTFGAVHTMEQAIYALFDLELHGERAEDIAQGRMSTTELFGQILGSTFPQIERDENYAYHHRFSHLVTYGAKYYSYLVARASASLIYARLFSADPLSRQSGQRWAEVQSHGGEYPSSVLLSKALGTAHSPGIEQLTQALVHGAPNIVDNGN